jgi:hypothetical protein
MVRFTRRLWNQPRIGLIAAALALVMHAQLDFWHTAQPESFGGMLTIGAILCAIPGKNPTRAWLRWLASGAIFGFAGLLKPPLVGGAGVVALWLGGRAWNQARADGRAAAVGAAVPPIAIMTAGVLTPILLCAIWFASRGAFGELYDTLFVFTPHYTKLGWNQSFGTMVVRAVTEWVFQYSRILPLGILIALARPRLEDREGLYLLLAVIALHIIGVALQGKYFIYHWGATWPLTALVAAVGWWRAWLYATRHGRLATLVLACMVAFVASRKSAFEPFSFVERSRARLELVLDGDRAGWDRLASVADVNAEANRAVADLLRQRVARGQPIFVWGFEPVIYDLAERPPASKFIYNVPLRVGWAAEETRRVLMQDLAARPPAAIVVERGDVFPFVTGDALDSAHSLLGFPELLELIRTRYERVALIEDFAVYVLAD